MSFHYQHRCRSTPLRAAVSWCAGLMLVDTSMGMILPTSPAPGKNPRTVDNAFNLQVMQMIRERDRVAGMGAMVWRRPSCGGSEPGAAIHYKVKTGGFVQ
ncbi:hypothetical protein XFF6992_470029 [Xanthomonas citri pv. fuscans]|uniref:Uncharacterized protein n=1 Tax=Xanthomonas campestris pv. phaseoli TaxID=317013 RepID=A0A7Z7J030_XANCH|nr:hypothetical protein XFF6990_430127 [Xanthomonas citri pv. fuscans]SOO20613.1 hypothetical protein XFF6992_470029 [Xanthomonas citri pv. fuscans]SOO24790.1 hypothetical protein XFF6991_420007 [Xanthomonas phaseoli pv. phaseoli]SOO34888.1 hypothetical protein XFF6994_4700007 [Xanthomonas citri pv. fuscans]